MKTVALKRAATVTLGKMLQSEAKTAGDAERPYLRAANVQPDGRLAVDDVKTMWFGAAEVEQLDLRTGDVVVVEGGQGGFGRAAFVDRDLEGWGFQNSINRLRPTGDNDGRFLTYVLLALRESGWIRAYCNIVSMPHLTADKLAAIQVPLPDPAGQRSIADYLDRETAQLDELIAEQESLVSLLEERRRRVIDGTVGEWPMKKLRRHARIGNGSTPRREQAAYWTDGSVPWVNSSVVNLPEVLEASEFVTPTAVAECHLPMAPPGSILIGLTGEGRTRGSATITAIPTTMNQHLAYVTTTDDTWIPRFLLMAVRAAYEHLRFISGGGGSTKGALTCADLAAVRLPAPPIDEQNRIVELIDRQTTQIDQLASESRELVDLLRERRAALITAAVTGQIDVRAS